MDTKNMKNTVLDVLVFFCVMAFTFLGSLLLVGLCFGIRNLFSSNWVVADGDVQFLRDLMILCYPIFIGVMIDSFKKRYIEESVNEKEKDEEAKRAKHAGNKILLYCLSSIAIQLFITMILYFLFYDNLENRVFLLFWAIFAALITCALFIYTLYFERNWFSGMKKLGTWGGVIGVSIAIILFLIGFLWFFQYMWNLISF